VSPWPQVNHAAVVQRLVASQLRSQQHVNRLADEMVWLHTRDAVCDVRRLYHLLPSRGLTSVSA